MFEDAEVGRKIDKRTYNKELPELRTALLDAQFALKQRKDFSVVVVMAGVEAGGKGDTANTLSEWFDARGVDVHAIDDPTQEELSRPYLYRFWRRLPPKGSMAIFLGSWYTQPIVDRVFGRINQAQFDLALDRIVQFEQMLVQEDVLLVKIWLHLSKKAQRKKLDQLGSDPTTRWRVSARDWSFHMRYDEFRPICEYALRKTSSEHATWRVLDAKNQRYRLLTAGREVLSALRERLAAPPAEPAKVSADHHVPKPDNVLRQLDLTQSIGRKPYKRRMTELQGRLNRLSRHLSDRDHSLVLVFEGTDAAGKGGTIRRVKRAFDARYVRVIPIAAPTDEEKARPYLWRFWRHIPAHGRTVIFDRSWYGRVLVERVEGFCSVEDWQRAYDEINAFERQLTQAGAIVIKFWLAIAKDEQLARFQAREATGFKRWKLTDEDWRNRAKWDAYEAAICDMVERTHTEQCPWVLVEANDKPFARVKVLQTITDILAERLGIKGQPLSEGGLASLLT